jgi:hypothetical protein
LDRGQVDVIPEPSRESRRGAVRVKSGAIEAAIHRSLDASPQGLEEGEDDERRAGDCGRAAAGERLRRADKPTTRPAKQATVRP